MLHKKFLSAEDVLKLIGEDDQRPVSRVPAALRDGYLRAAAVLTAIGDIGSLKPALKVGKFAKTQLAASDVLRDQLILTTGSRFDGAVMLAPDVRREILATFHERGEILDALEANPGERKSELQAHFERYLLGTPKPLERQSLEELERTLQVALWAEGLKDVPAADDVRQLIELKRLLLPFEALAGGDRFRGRQREIDILRSFVGVVPPDSLLRRLGSALNKWVVPDERAALNVYGPGGVGKSALIARFMLEHTQVRDDIKIPFAYLDFDRPALDISDPLSLLVEALRQLSLQFPEGHPYEELLGLGKSVQRGTDSAGSEDRYLAARALFADVLGTLQTKLGPRPFVVVLDTFEEIQYRGETRASQLWQLLGEMQKRWPFLRVVISGRAPVRSLYLAGSKPESLELGGLDKESAVAILQADGIADEELAGRLVDQVGGVPLSLKLVAEMFKREMIENGGVKDLKTRSAFWISASAEVIQGQLYERILGHIHEEQVRRVAHPGLVLRYITPEVILHVLNEPCALGISTIEEARALFHKLAQETSLVSRDDNEGALLHRADLRRLMLDLLYRRDPARVTAIHKNAVAYYRNQTDLRSRAELLYHRASLGEPISQQDIEDPEVRSSLQSSISELPHATQAQLAAFGLQVAQDILESASREQNDAYLQSQVEEAFSYGTSALSQIDTLEREITSHLDRATHLYRTAARIKRFKRDDEAALALIEEGVPLSVAARRTTLTTELLAEKAWALRGKPTMLEPALDALYDYAGREQNPVFTLQECLQRQELLADAPGAKDRLDAIAMQLLSLNEAQLWDLAPAFEKVMLPLARRHPEMMTRVAWLVTSENSRFNSSRFPTSEANLELRVLIDGAYKMQSSEDKKEAEEAAQLATCFSALCKVWPYPILEVRPPYYRYNQSRLSRSQS